MRCTQIKGEFHPDSAGLPVAETFRRAICIGTAAVCHKNEKFSAQR